LTTVIERLFDVLLKSTRWMTVFYLAGSITALFYGGTTSASLAALALACGFIPLARAWKATRGTALRPALIWAGITLGLSLASELTVFSEPLNSGRPLGGQIAYLSTIAAFATLISVLNARTPGSGAWGILMVMLVVVFLVPWLEGGGLVREGNGWDRLRLTAPWTIFYGLLVIAGVTNFLPTRFGSAAAVLGLGFVLEFLGLTRADWSHETKGLIWTAVPLCWACSAWLADIDSHRRPTTQPGLERLWWWFRNGWGVVWALRVQERFNKAAESARWPFRLTWHGVVSIQTESSTPFEIPDAAEATLAGLLRRFAERDVIEAAAGYSDA
jgi:hypothetical protein